MVFPLARVPYLSILVLALSILAMPLPAGAQTPVPAPPGGDVPMYRADEARSGSMPGPGLTGPPSLLWWFETASPMPSTPAIVDGIAYFGDGLLGGGGLRAVDTATGEELWSAELPGQPFGSSPAVSDGMAFIGDLGGNVTGVDITAESVAWSVAIGGDVTSSPAAVDGTVYIRNGEDVLFALDAATGEERWQFATGGEGGYTLDTAPAVVDGVVYMTTIDSERDESLFALDAETGEEIWSFEPDTPGLYTPAVVDGVVYAGGDGGIVAVDAASGEQIWNAPIGEVFSAPAVGDGMVVIHTSNDAVAVDAATGEERWRYRTAGSWSAPALVDGVVYVGSQGMGRIGLHMLDAASGEMLWHVRAVGSMNGSPVVTGGVVYAATNDGLFALGEASSALAAPADRVLETLVGRFVFALGVDADGRPVEPGAQFPSGTATVKVHFAFLGVPEGATYTISWFLDGELLFDSESMWEFGSSGNANDGISANEGALPDGTYEAVISFDGEQMQHGTFTIGG